MTKSLLLGTLLAANVFAVSMSSPQVVDSTHFTVSVNGQTITLTKSQAKALKARLTAGSALIKDAQAEAKKDAYRQAKKQIDEAFENKAE